MKKRFSEEQIVGILKEATVGETTIAEVCRSHRISEATFYQWRRRYGGMQVKEARRLRDLERENGRLKRLMAERDLEIDALRQVLEKNF
jgi:putative transposase